MVNGCILVKVVNCIFKTYHSGIGDCVFILLRDEGAQYAIMVDCGKLEDDIEAFIREELAWKIDLLIVTHIDNDHIEGITELLKKPEVQVGKIIFNCYRRKGKAGRRLSVYQEEKLATIKREIGYVVGDIVEHDVDARTAMTGLAATILENPAMKKAWDADYSISGMCLNLEEWGSITFLSPTQKDLDNLDHEFRHVLFDELNVDNTMGEWKKQEDLYEILLRYIQTQYPDTDARVEKATAGETTLEAELTRASKEPVNTESISTANKASLAFVWEKDGKKILVLGDANPDVVVEGLLEHYKEKSFPILFDAIKVSHHGSHYNTTTEMLRHADSAHYFFTGGTEGKRPSAEAIGRIVLRELPEGVEKRILHFNYCTSIVKAIEKDKEIQKKYHFKVDTKDNEQRITV